jgi:hypothetical protein
MRPRIRTTSAHATNSVISHPDDPVAAKVDEPPDPPDDPDDGAANDVAFVTVVIGATATVVVVEVVDVAVVVVVDAGTVVVVDGGTVVVVDGGAVVVVVVVVVGVGGGPARSPAIDSIQLR